MVVEMTLCGYIKAIEGLPVREIVSFEEGYQSLVRYRLIDELMSSI